VRSAKAYAKINLGLVVGPVRNNGKHEIVTVLQRVDLYDTVEVETVDSEGVVVDGFDDTIVHCALEALVRVSRKDGGWRVSLLKRIPVASGLGGGSSDAAAALALANGSLATPLTHDELHAIAMRVGSDVPFFLTNGTQLATGDGSDLTPAELPLEFSVLLLLPEGESKTSTADVYAHFDEARAEAGFEERRDQLLAALAHVATPRDLDAFPKNDLVSSPLSERLEALGAFRADVSGAGPTVYGLFEERAAAERAAASLSGAGQVWVVEPTDDR
jgi:4-diphosphocytidyl-2-C-methyl-D-erythritol kinase